MEDEKETQQPEIAWLKTIDEEPTSQPSTDFIAMLEELEYK